MLAFLPTPAARLSTIFALFSRLQDASKIMIPDLVNGMWLVTIRWSGKQNLTGKTNFRPSVVGCFF
jgi:hypothetical protein